MFYNFDILRVSRANRAYLNLSDYKLKTLEKFLGIERTDAISGKESVEMYFDYLSSKDSSLKEKILLHNYEDILNIVDLFSIFNFCKQSTIFKELDYPIDILPPDSKTYFEENFIRKLGLSASISSLKLYLSDYVIKDNLLTCTLTTSEIFNMDFIYSFNDLKLCLENENLVLSLPLINFNIEGTEYLFIDIDPIFEKGSFNKLSSKEKMDLNVSTKKIINPQRIIEFLTNDLYSIISRLII